MATDATATDAVTSGQPSVSGARRVEACRSCGARGLVPFLHLGDTPIANELLSEGDLAAAEPRFPLEVGFCPSCALVQVLWELPADVIFDADYPYFSSFSAYLVEHAREHAEGLTASRGLTGSSRVVEIASNDGYLLQHFVKAGIPALGVEPTPGPAKAAREAGVETVQEFFGVETAKRLKAAGWTADVMIANNVLAHVPDMNDFVGGFAELLADDGVITFENPSVRYLIEHGEFDTIYHEHYCYLSCHSVQALVNRHGLYLNAVEHFPDLHGGTLRWWVSRNPEQQPSAVQHLAEERELGLDTIGYYEDFSQRVTRIQTDLVALLRELRAGGARIAAYGAAAKGATLLNSTGISTDLVEFVVDRNTHKQGKYMPGCRLPIVDPAALLEQKPDAVLLLVWNVAKEVLAQQAAYREAGGRFIVPVPSPQLL